MITLKRGDNLVLIVSDVDILELVAGRGFRFMEPHSELMVIYAKTPDTLRAMLLAAGYDIPEPNANDADYDKGSGL